MASTADWFIADSSTKMRLSKHHLRMRFALLAPILPVELLGPASWDCQRFPLLPGMDSGNLNNLADVIAGVAQGALQRQRHGMRLSTDHHGLFEVFPLQA